MPRKKKRKGRHGEGSVFACKDGGHGYSLMQDGQREQRRSKAWSWEEAETYLTDLLDGIEVRQERQKEETVEEYMEFWLSTVIVPPYRAISTNEMYEQIIRNHINPAIGHKKLKSLRREDAQRLMTLVAAKVNRRGVMNSPKTVRHVRCVLSSALQTAVKWGRVKENVATGLQMPPAKKWRMNPYTEEEVAKLLRCALTDRKERRKNCPNPYRDFVIYSIAVTMGLRQMEILNLEWSDIDFSTREMEVRGTKTAESHRTLILPPSLVTILQRQKAELAQWRLQTPREEWHGGDRLFLRDNSRPFLAAACLYGFHELQKRYGLRNIRFHDLRHTAATLRLQRGDGIHEVAKLLGHTNINQTLSTYAHVLEEMKTKSADRMDSILRHFTDGEPVKKEG